MYNRERYLINSSVRVRGVDQRKIDRLLSEGYKLRRKDIKSRNGLHSYAYTQKGRRFIYLGSWEVVRGRIGTRAHERKEGAPSTALAEIAKKLAREKSALEGTVFENERNLLSYVKEVLPHEDPSLWAKLNDFTEGHWKEAIEEAIRDARPFSSEVKDAAYSGGEAPTVHSHIVRVLELWFQKYIAGNLGAKHSPGTISSKCQRCQSKLVAYRSPSGNFTDSTVQCEKCGSSPIWRCRLCENPMRFEGTQELRCDQCGFLSVLEHPIELRMPHTKSGIELDIALQDEKWLSHSERFAMVRQYERNLNYFQWHAPWALFFFLRNHHFSGRNAHSIMFALLAKEDAWEPIEQVCEFVASHHPFYYLGENDFDNVWLLIRSGVA